MAKGLVIGGFAIGAAVGVLGAAVGWAMLGGEQERDVAVSIADLPRAVLATLEAELSKGGTVEEIDLELGRADGMVVYSVDSVRDGVAWEIEIAEDGRLLSSGAEGDDQEDGEGED